MTSQQREMFELWYKEKYHPEELPLGVSGTLKQLYRDYYQEKQNGK